MAVRLFKVGFSFRKHDRLRHEVAPPENFQAFRAFSSSSSSVQIDKDIGLANDTTKWTLKVQIFPPETGAVHASQRSAKQRR